MEKNKEILELVKTYRISESEFTEFKNFCEANDLTRSEVIRQGIKMYIKLKEFNN